MVLSRKQIDHGIENSLTETERPCRGTVKDEMRK